MNPSEVLQKFDACMVRDQPAGISDHSIFPRGMKLSSKSPFPFPLQIGCLHWFCHPVESHPFAAPVWHEGEALTANTYMGLRFSRGLWNSSDFGPASPAFLARFNSLHWSRFHGIPDKWQALDDIRGHLYKRPPIHPWTTAGKVAASPLWRVGDVFLARLCHLQLIARLPRCEINLAHMNTTTPLLFRFNGGIGILAAVPTLGPPSFSVFQTHRDETGAPIARNQGPCVLPPKRPKWPDFEPLP